MTNRPRPGERVAIVGTGIAGLTTAHLLAPRFDVTVFEARERLGGHTHTIDVPSARGTTAVDTGFIVFNDRNYPHFTALMDELGVASQPSDMSFSVSCQRTGLEYNGTSANTLFAQRRNLFRPRFLFMLRDILRFAKDARALLATPGDELPLGAFLERHGYSRSFREHYLLPMGAAVWSTSPERMLGFPARLFLRFFEHHGFLDVSGRPQWRTIRGGSREYIGPLSARFANRIRLGAAVEAVRRHDEYVELDVRGCDRERFDHVVLACHSDQALRMLSDASATERMILGAIPYQENRVILHRDAQVMPRTPRAWASWNTTIPQEAAEHVTVSYFMNRLQNLPEDEPFFVTLNPTQPIEDRHVLRELRYDHPLFTPESVAAQARYAEIGGVRRTHFCGAYWRHGFHEDGVWSALRVAADFGEETDHA